MSIRWTLLLLLGVALAIAAGEPSTLAAEEVGLASAGISEVEFFSLLDYSLPYLAKVKAAVDAGDYAAAKVALLAAMRARRKPITTVWWESWRGPATLNWWHRPKQTNPAYDRTVADRICRHIFSGAVISSYPDYDMGPVIDWGASPCETREWTYVLNRHPNWVFLGQAYWATGDEKYAREFNAEVIDWVARCPRITDGTHQASASWRTIEAGIRMLYSWPVSYQYFLQSPSFTPEANYLLMRSLVDHARHLSANPTGGNWVVMEMDGLVHVGTLFPEFKDASAWRQAGMQRLGTEITRQVCPDGLQFELATDYHVLVVICFTGAMAVQEANGIAVPQPYRDSLAQLYEATMYMTKPSGEIPAFSDAVAKIEGVEVPWTIEPYVSAAKVLERGADLLGRADVKYAATHGRKGKPPREVSRALPYSGFYVMRSGWDQDARYLAFDAGPFGAGGHQHEDKLSMVVYAYGRTLLFDTGCGPYASSPYRRFYVSTAGHNSVLVDGEGQNRRAQIRTEEQRRWTPTTLLSNPWVSKPEFDYASGTYDEGYGPGRDKAVTHRRQVLFVKPDYWVVVDDLRGSGAHRIDTLWHLRPGGYVVDPATSACMTANPGEANLLVLPARSDGLTVDVAVGRTDPVAGWLSITCGYLKVAAPQATYTWRGSLPKTLAWLVYPSRDMLRAKPRMDPIPVSGATGAAAFKVTLPNGAADFVLLAQGIPGIKRCGALETDAEVAVVRVDAHGQVSSVGREGGTYLDFGGLQRR